MVPRGEPGSWRRDLRRSMSPYLVLLLTLAPTLFSYWRVSEYVQARDLARFESEVQTAENTIRLGRVSHFNTMRCLQAFFNATPQVDAYSWKLFGKAIEWKSRFPQMLDLGYVERSQSAAGADRWVVRYHESQLENGLHSEGSDLAQSADYRLALDQLARTGLLTATGELTLDDTPVFGPRHGIVLFLPVYEPGTLPPATVEKAGGTVKGAVFTSFNPASIYAGHQGVSNRVLNLELISPAPQRTAATKRNGFERILRLPPLGHKTMALRCTPGAEFALGSYQALPQVVLLGGLALSVSLFSLTVVLAAGRTKAETANDELLAAEGKITKLNQDLERRIRERTGELEQTNQQLREEINERRRAESALQNSEARLRAMWDHAPEGIVIIDAATRRLIDSNGRGPELFGLERAALLGHTPEEFCPERQPDGEFSSALLQRQMDEAMRGGTPTFEWVIRQPSGRELPCETKLVRLPADDKNLLIGTLTDITARKQAEEELLKALHQEKSLSQLRSRVVNLVSHEFRTPLSIIMSSAEILDEHLDRLPPEQRQSQLHAIIKATREMSGLMEEVLMLGRVESGQLPFEPVQLNLHVLCQRLVSEVLAATKNQCEISFESHALPEFTFVDERLLRHIFTNLLTNAVKYSPPNRNVRFVAWAGARNFEFEIVDHGIGIHPEDLKNVFQAFHRGRNVGQIPGSGLGMMIIRRCVQFYGGNIQVESTLGAGTTIRVILPAFHTLEAAEEHGRSQTGTTFLRRDPNPKNAPARIESAPGKPA